MRNMSVYIIFAISLLVSSPGFSADKVGEVCGHKIRGSSFLSRFITASKAVFRVQYQTSDLINDFDRTSADLTISYGLDGYDLAEVETQLDNRFVSFWWISRDLPRTETYNYVVRSFIGCEQLTSVLKELPDWELIHAVPLTGGLEGETMVILKKIQVLKDHTTPKPTEVTSLLRTK